MRPGRQKQKRRVSVLLAVLVVAAVVLNLWRGRGPAPTVTAGARAGHELTVRADAASGAGWRDDSTPAVAPGGAVIPVDDPALKRILNFCRAEDEKAGRKREQMRAAGCFKRQDVEPTDLCKSLARELDSLDIWQTCLLKQHYTGPMRASGCEGLMKNGEYDGTWVCTFESGDSKGTRIREVTEFINGRQHGLSTTYRIDPGGSQPRAEREDRYLDGQVVSTSLMAPDGTSRRVLEERDGEGAVTSDILCADGVSLDTRVVVRADGAISEKHAVCPSVGTDAPAEPLHPVVELKTVVRLARAGGA